MTGKDKMIRVRSCVGCPISEWIPTKFGTLIRCRMKMNIEIGNPTTDFISEQCPLEDVPDTDTAAKVSADHKDAAKPPMPQSEVCKWFDINSYHCLNHRCAVWEYKCLGSVACSFFEKAVSSLPNVETNYSAETANDKQDDEISVGDTVECIRGENTIGGYLEEGGDYLVIEIPPEDTNYIRIRRIEEQTGSYEKTRFEKVKQDDKERADGKGEAECNYHFTVGKNDHWCALPKGHDGKHQCLCSEKADGKHVPDDCPQNPARYNPAFPGLERKWCENCEPKDDGKGEVITVIDDAKIIEANLSNGHLEVTMQILKSHEQAPAPASEQKKTHAMTEDYRYQCNQAVGVTEEKVAKYPTKPTCKNCLKIIARLEKGGQASDSEPTIDIDEDHPNVPVSKIWKDDTINIGDSDSDTAEVTVNGTKDWEDVAIALAKADTAKREEKNVMDRYREFKNYESAEKNAKKELKKMRYGVQPITCCSTCSHYQHYPESSPECTLLSGTWKWSFGLINEFGLCDKYEEVKP